MNESSPLTPLHRNSVLPLALLMAVACGAPSGQTGESTPDLSNTSDTADLAPFRSITSEVMAQLEEARQITAFMRSGNAATEFTAWVSQEGDLILIQETVGMGDYGNGRSRYVFRDGGLHHYTSQFTTLFVAEPSRARRRLVDVEMGFDPPAPIRGGAEPEGTGPGRTASAASRLPTYSGRVVVNKTVDGQSVRLEEHEIPGVRARALLLADSVLSRLSAREERPSGA